MLTGRRQTVETQAAGRLIWTVVAVYRTRGISGASGRQQRPGLDALSKGLARRDFDLVRVVGRRLGRSLSDVIGLLGGSAAA
jgi:DNA invertase Pin-like site-specific DNA recombinase